MSYGRSEYGQSGYGGASFEAGGITLVSSIPANAAAGIAPAATVTITLNAPAGIDEYTLDVDFDSNRVIAAGAFTPGNNGTLTYTETGLTIVVSTHPAFAAGPNTVTVRATDNAAVAGVVTFGFTVGEIAAVGESLTVSDAVAMAFNAVALTAETLTFTETLSLVQAHGVAVSESLAVTEGAQFGVLQGLAASAYEVQLSLAEEIRFEELSLESFSIQPGPNAAPIVLTSATPLVDVVQTGSSGRVVDLGAPDGMSSQFSITGSVTGNNVGDYVEIQNGRNFGRYRIDAVLGANLVQLDRALVVADLKNGYANGLVEIVDAGTKTFRLNVPEVTSSDPIVSVSRIEIRGAVPTVITNPAFTLIDYRTFQITSGGFTVSASDRVFVTVSLSAKVVWKHTTAVKGVSFRIAPKLTGGAVYVLSARNLRTKIGNAPLSVTTAFPASSAVVPKPRAISATFIPDDGTIIVRYDQPMRHDDANLGNPADYVISGPSTVRVKSVVALDDTTVALQTSGIGAGDHTLTISTSTPKDVAGNPLDPLFNALIFTASVPEIHRSVFTDKGPIAKPPLTLQTGVAGTFHTYNEVTLTGSTLTSSLIGKMVRITGPVINSGTFRIASIISSTRAKLANASFTLPDATSFSWQIFDPRDGEIADDPSDVAVRVNGSSVTPEAVVGLLGQIVLPAAPDPSDDVKVDYSWILNPTVDVRRLNSKEFRLNSWNRDVGYGKDASQHKYRYNNTLARPGDYVAANMLAKLDQPQLRELHYRAYERAYTPTLNDPTLLLLNSPTHRIAYPPAQRTLAEEFVNYEGTGLPESLVTAPWVRKGTGTATSTLGQLTVVDDSSGVYPTGKPIFWTRTIDLTFPHVFAMSWRFVLTNPTQPDGVFTGVAAGYSTDQVAVVVGYLIQGGVRKIGILKRGFADDPSAITAWSGGLDALSNPTGAPADLDWSVLHSFRIFRDKDGTIKVFVDGDVDPVLRVVESELPYLEEVAAPFDSIQGVFFGALTRPARSTSTWDFVRYLVQPTNPTQAGPSSFVSYEGNVKPESDAKPWTPVGYHGTATVLNSDTLLLDSTSATDVATAADVGLMGGDFRAYARIEPLLTVASEYVIDTELQLRTQTHGISPYGLTLAVDDGERLTQLCFFPDRATPKLSYGGRSLPQDFAPYAWQKAGTASTTMAGRVLRIDDSSVSDGAVFFIDDNEPAVSDTRVVAGTSDYMLEFRCRVVSYTADGSGFAGAFGHVYDSSRSVGLMFQEVGGTKYVSFHSDGITLGVSARFAFNWGDAQFHTYRVTKSTAGNLVSVFVDGVFLGSFPYSSFSAPAMDPSGQVSFGSSTPASSGARSVVEWAYANAWRTRTDLKKYVGIWKGSDADSLLGYHLPLKVSGRNATIAGNALGDGNANFITANVIAGDKLVVDAGPNRGVYEVAAVSTATSLTIVGTWPTQPSLADYRIVKETDWTTLRKYRLLRDTTGEVAVILGTDTAPAIRIGYNSIDLPASGVGVIKTIADGLPAVVFGSLDSENLAQSSWEYVRYGITRTVTELRIAPHHQVVNQWNVMHSPERLFTVLPHTLTSFKSSSTGHPPKTDPDFLADSGLPAWTQLNQGTPLVPLTQNFQTRGPYPTQTYVSALNRPEDVLNSDGDFSLNDSTIRYELIIPKDVLYSSLDVIEQTSGEENLLAPFSDECQPKFKGFQYQKEVCLAYSGATLPENDPTAATPWTLASDNPAQVTASASGGVLTYGTGGSGTRTIYRNDTPLPDHPSLQTEAKFRIRLLQDSTGGVGDSQVKFGLSAPGLTVALAFVTSPLGERLVLILDLNTGITLGSVSFDFLDGAYHTYRIVRDPGAGEVRVFIDS